LITTALVNIDEKMLVQTAVLMRNLDNHSSIENFTCFTQHCDGDFKRDLVKLAGPLNFEIDFLAIDDELDAMPYTSSTSIIPNITYGRLMAGKLLPKFASIAYFDVDINIRSSIDSLLKTDFKQTIAAVLDIATRTKGADGHAIERYFNSGVLAINLNSWRENETDDKVQEIMRSRPNLDYMDQDVLNLLFENDWFELNQKYNFAAERRNRFDYPECLAEDSVIVHFSGYGKPWTYPVASDLHREWRKKELEVIGKNSKKWIESFVGYSLLRMYRMVIPRNFAKYVRIHLNPLLIALGINKVRNPGQD